jgi:molybdenum cofactor synthesis domain-containing protein
MIRVAIVTVSDSAVAGTRADLSGPALEKHVLELGWMVVTKSLIPDESQQIATLLASLADGGSVDVILTTGGTGLTLRDVTPEATRTIAHREVPGFGELMRAEGRKSARFAALSRGGAATRGTTLIVNLPGSPRGAVDSLIAVADLIPHSVDLLQGRTEHSPQRAK